MALLPSRGGISHSLIFGVVLLPCLTKEYKRSDTQELSRLSHKKPWITACVPCNVCSYKSPFRTQAPCCNKLKTLAKSKCGRWAASQQPASPWARSTWTSSPVEPSDDCGPSWHATTTRFKGRTSWAQPPPKMREKMINCSFKPLSLETVSYTTILLVPTFSLWWNDGETSFCICYQWVFEAFESRTSTLTLVLILKWRNRGSSWSHELLRVI